MKHLALLLSSVCLLAAPALPARASLAVDVAAVDNWQCLVWLLTDPATHAAECGGPFTMDRGTEPLVKGTFTEGCQLITSVDLPDLDFLERIHVAQSQDDCCYLVGGLPTPPATFDLTFGEEIKVAAQPCYPD